MAEPALPSEAAITPVDEPEDGPEELKLVSSDAHEDLKLPRLPDTQDKPIKSKPALVSEAADHCINGKTLESKDVPQNKHKLSRQMTARFSESSSRLSQGVVAIGRSGARVLGLQSAADVMRALNFDRSISRAVKRRRQQGMRTRIMRFLDEPKSSLAAGAVFSFVVVLILISVATVFVDSMVDNDETTQMVVEVLELVCSIAFTVEVIIRIVCMPDGLIICASDPFMWIDILAVLPFALEYTLFQAVDADFDLDFLRLVRLLRLLKLARHYEQSRVLLFTLKLSAEGLLVRGARGGLLVRAC